MTVGDQPPTPNAPDRVTVMVVDDHELFLEGLALLVSTMPGCEVVGMAHDGAQAVDLARRLAPRVVLMDARMPNLSGPEAIASLVADLPGTAVVMVTMFADDDLVFQAMRAGAKGYVLKGASKDELQRAIMAAANGEALFDHDIVERFARYFSVGQTGGPLAFGLTPREREVLELLARGLHNHEMAKELRVTAKTVRNHVSNVISKLGVTSRYEAATKAREAGLLRGRA